MALLWREQLSVGNNVIDTDHRYLIDIINRVEQCLITKNRRELAFELENLSKYSLVHFEREEKIALAVGYIRLPKLNESHVALLNRLNQMRAEFDGAGVEWSSEAAKKFTEFLRNWLIDHVIKEDLLMKPALMKHSPTFDPR